MIDQRVRMFYALKIVNLEESLLKLKYTTEKCQFTNFLSIFLDFFD
jgi:hypothetical protein